MRVHATSWCLLAFLLACGGASQPASADGGARPDAGVPPDSDGGAPDGSAPDAGSPDGSTPDAGPTDAGAADAGPATGEWLRFGFDPARSGVNPQETTLGPENVPRLRRLWRVRLPGVADSAPAFLPGVSRPGGGTRDLLFVTTREGATAAVDAAAGATVWTQRPEGPNVTNASPVVDPSGPTVYAYGLDGRVHAYQAASGTEITAPGLPAQITQMPQTEKGSSALNLASGRLYATTSGYLGDAPPYQGHVVVVELASGTTRVFNGLCSDVHALLSPGECASQRAGIWGRGGAVVDAETGRVFVTTGNGPFDADQGGHDYGDSVLALSADGSRLLDSYTPQNHAELDVADADLGSAAPALLPRIAAGKAPLLLVQGGKDGRLRLLDRTDLSGQGGPGHLGGALQELDSAGCATFTQPAVWQSGDGTILVFVAGTCGLVAYRAETDASGTTRLVQAWQIGLQATSPVLAGGVLFAATSGHVEALDPLTGRRLWSSLQASAGGTIGAIHWESPIVVGGRLYVPDQSGTLTAYGLPGG